LGYIKIGCEVQGLSEIPEDVKKTVMIGQKDYFGGTENTSTMEQLLSKLPEPQTIITDIYIVDRFPELKGKIRTSEFLID
jgi:hypothetical protein